MRDLKDRVGRIAYVWTGAKNVKLDPVEMSIDVDGARWFEGEASCVLVGNVGDVFGGLSVFTDAVPDDGYLDLGVVTARVRGSGHVPSVARSLAMSVGRRSSTRPPADRSRSAWPPRCRISSMEAIERRARS
jgi:diacylglycerol kinase family enzyme